MKKIIISVLSIAIVISVIFFAYKYSHFEPDAVSKCEYEGMLIKDVYTDKARYKPKDIVDITVSLNKNFNKTQEGKLNIYFKYLGKTIDIKKINYSINSNKDTNLHIKWEAPKDDFRGYQIEVYAYNGISVYDNRNTAADVSSDWSKFPRYGYIADYPKQDSSVSNKIIDNLNKYHIDGLQFYDWQYKHNKPLAGTEANPEEEWSDIANRDTYGQTIKDYIQAAHSKNMIAANYNLMFGGYEDYDLDGAKQEWGLFKDTNHEEQDFHPLPSNWATNKLMLFNPANKDWQNYIFNQEKTAMQVYNFDAWHVDTLGQRDGMTFDYNGNAVELSAGYKDFLNNAKQAVGTRILFNPVNAYGEMETVPNTDLDFLYKEVWPKQYSSYSDLKQAIDVSRGLTKNKKNVVLAAYMNYELAKSGGKFNEPGVKLTDAAIFAAGGAHIELGDTGMLCNEYFPNKDLTMSNSLQKSMRNYYDFSVAYENLLRDNLTDCDNVVEIPNTSMSDSSEANSIWAFSKEKPGYNTIQLINNIGNNSDKWVDDDGEVKEPVTQTNFKLKYYIKDTVKKVWLASPDINDGKAKELSYSIKKDTKGQYLQIKVPSLQYWNMIYIEK